MVKLDVKDKRILHQLDVNSRQSNAEIAKKVGLSKQVVGFRIKRLFKDEVLSSCYTVIDIAKLGLTSHKSFLRLQNINKEKQIELIEWLKNNQNVVWLASCDGKYDLIFGMQAKNIEELEKNLKEFNLKFGDYISERQIATIIKGEYSVRDYLVDQKESKSTSKAYFGGVSTKAVIDKKDGLILFTLGKDARTTIVEMAKITQLSPDAVSKRLKKLEQTGVIQHYNIVPNESSYPYLHYKIIIGLRNATETKEKALLAYCRNDKNIVYTVKALGPWDFEIDLEVKNIEDFRGIMMSLKSKFQDIIKDYSALLIYQVHKYNFCPSIPESS
ncbi:MAG: Lrp/AsnC family transcriptional regulator [Nanoarchaeota archaeon]|nr:Lrp/AsnC family transcriptional regulator [Nanoarchaeota archaeon]